MTFIKEDEYLQELRVVASWVIKTVVAGGISDDMKKCTKSTSDYVKRDIQYTRFNSIATS